MEHQIKAAFSVLEGAQAHSPRQIRSQLIATALAVYMSYNIYERWIHGKHDREPHILL